MPNRAYLPNLRALQTAQINWETADIRCILIDVQDYTVNTDTHEFLSSVPAAARVATTTIGGRTATVVAGIGSVLDGTDALFTAVVGDPSEALIIYLHTGNDATARLLFYFDTVTGLPVTPNGGDLTVRWSDGNSKIARFYNAA